MKERGRARMVARLACAAASVLACHVPAAAQSTGSAELDPTAPLEPLPDLGVEWPDVEAPDGLDAPDDGKSDGAADTLSTELTAKYGLRPRRYTGFFNDSKSAHLANRGPIPDTDAHLHLGLRVCADAR